MKKYPKKQLLKLLAGLLKEHGGELSRANYQMLEIGPNPSTFERAFGDWTKAKSAARKFGGVEEKIKTPVGEDFREKVVEYLKREPRTLTEICNAFDLSPLRAEKLLRGITETHSGLVRFGDKYVIEDVTTKGPDDLKHEVGKKERKLGRFGVLGDTHLGSKYQQISYLKEFYERCEKVGVDFMLHAGDLSDGNGALYKGQRFEMFLQGYREQKDYILENYPKIPGVVTKIVIGNHDESWIKSADINLVEEICAIRKDMEYLGRKGAYLFLEPDAGKTYLFHPDGGLAYALSYKIQKFIEGFSSENKPQLLLVGHYHQVEQGFLRNVHYMQVGCFQSQTPYLRGKGHIPSVGGWIVEYELAEDLWGLGIVKTELVPFYKMIEEDY